MALRIEGQLYYTVTEATRKIGVSRMTVYRWITGGLEIDGKRIDARRDRTSGKFYLAASSVEELLPENRFVRL